MTPHPLAIVSIVLASVIAAGCGTTVRRATDKQIGEASLDHAERDPVAARRWGALVQPHIDFAQVFGQSLGAIAHKTFVDHWDKGLGLAVLLWLLRRVKRAEKNGGKG